jgi:hypothetical protein
MNRADYIHLFKEACGGRCNVEYNPCAYRQAADSLTALKPVAWLSQGGEASRSANYFKEMGFTNLIPLYALEGNNENAPLS